MAEQPKIDFIAWGSREAMVAEVSAYDHSTYECFDGNPANYAFLVMPVGNAQWDTEGFATAAEAQAEARYLAEMNGVSVAAY